MTGLHIFVKKQNNLKTIGRINNRVEGGLVAVEGRSYYLPKNEGENTYNSGSEGLHKENFAYRIESNNLETKIIFSFLSREDRSSLPGDVYLNVTYLVKENDNRFIKGIPCYSCI